MNKKVTKLLQTFKNEKKDPRFIKRMSAVLQFKIGGLSTGTIATINGCSERSIRNWINSFDEKGVEGLKDLPKSGRPQKVSNKKMLEILSGMEQITTESARNQVNEETGVEYCKGNIIRRFHELDISWKLPRPYYIHQASSRKVKSFQKKVIPFLLAAFNSGIPVFICDEVHLKFDDNCRSKVWDLKGKRVRIPYENQYKSLRFFGAYDLYGELFHIQYEGSFTSLSFVQCLNLMHQQVGRFIVLADNARAHTAKRVQKFCDKKGIELIFLPVGRPEISAIETIWQKTNKKFIHGKFHKDIEQLVFDITDYFNEGFNLNIIKYLQKKVDNNKLHSK